MKTIRLFGCLAFFATLTSGVEFQCKYEIANLNGLGSSYICHATIISVERPSITTNISGTHEAGKVNADVNNFWVENHRILTKIPNGIEQSFANLQVFLWRDGRISTIDSNTFKPFPNLLIIYLGYNQLVTLDGDLFQHTRKLRELFFESNLFEHVDHDILTGLTDLTFADFSSNPCIDAWADTPEGMQELKLQLTIQCPPLVIECPRTCMIDEVMERIEKLERPDTDCPSTCTSNDETDEMKTRMDEMQSQIVNLTRIVAESMIPIPKN